MKERPGFITFKYVVHSVFNDMNVYRFDPNQYQRFLQFAVEGFLDLQMFHINNYKVAHLTPNKDSNTVSLPDDMIYYNKIGVRKGKKFYTLTINNELLEDPVCNNEDLGSVGRSTSVYYWLDHYKDGNFIEGLYSVGGGLNENYYRVDMKNRIVLLGDKLRNTDELLVEYKSTGVSTSEDTVIPIQALQALKAWVHWQRVDNDERVPANNKLQKENRYYNEVEKLRMLDLPTVDEIVDVLSSTYRQTPKR